MCIFWKKQEWSWIFQLLKNKEVIFKVVLQVFFQGQDLGFGQSLLVIDKFVFDVLLNNGEFFLVKNFFFIRGYMSDVLIFEFFGINIIVIEDRLLSYNSFIFIVSKVEQDVLFIEIKDYVDFSLVRVDFSDKIVSLGLEFLL